MLACRWTAENSRGPSNSKAISSGCPPKELLSQPTHLLPARTTEAQTSAAVECHSNRRSYNEYYVTLLPILYSIFYTRCFVSWLHSRLHVICSYLTYLSSFHFEIRSKYWHLRYGILNIKPGHKPGYHGTSQSNDISAEDQNTVISRSVGYYSIDPIQLGSSKPIICTIHC